MTLVPLTPYSPLLTSTVAQVSLAGALAPKTQLGVVTHDGAAYLKAPTTDAGTGLAPAPTALQGVFRSFNEPT